MARYFHDMTNVEAMIKNFKICDLWKYETMARWINSSGKCLAHNCRYIPLRRWNIFV